MNFRVFENGFFVGNRIFLVIKAAVGNLFNLAENFIEEGKDYIQKSKVKANTKGNGITALYQ